MIFNFSFIKSLFKPKKVTFLGRAGLLYLYNGEKYFVDSEMLVGPEYDIVIYENSIRYESPNRLPLDSIEKAKIAIDLKSELEIRGLVVDLGW